MPPRVYQPKKLYDIVLEKVASFETIEEFVNKDTATDGGGGGSENENCDADTIFAWRIISPVPMISKILPKTIYIDYLNCHFQNPNCWDQMLLDHFNCSDEDIGLWNWMNLTFEQAILLQNHPPRAPRFVNENNLVIKTRYQLENMINSPYLCLDCASALADNYLDCSIRQTVEISRGDESDVLENYLWKEHSWCFKCKYTPLFVIESYAHDGFLETDYTLSLVFPNTLVRGLRSYISEV